MTNRLNSAERRAQIASVALSLLADHAIEKLTTRVVAKAVGVSQPALFRHFRSRDQILEAAVLEARSRLALVAERILCIEGSIEQLEALPHRLLTFIEENPGLPRLLFYDASDDEEHSFHLQLRGLLDMQANFVGALVASAVQERHLSEALDTQRAGKLFVSLVQGTLLSWLHGGRSESLELAAEDLNQLFLTGLRAGIPSRAIQKTPPPAPVETTKYAYQFLDARPLLAAGQDPLNRILAALERLEAGGTLELLVPFLPRPLLQLMENQGHTTLVDELEERLFRVFIRSAPSAVLHDFRELEAPEPLERTLELVGELAADSTLQVLVPRTPHVLLPHLKQRNILFTVKETFDGAALLTLHRAPRTPGCQS